MLWKCGLRLKNWSLRVKLILSFLCILTVFAGTSIFNLYQMQSIQEQISAQNSKMEKKLLMMELKQKLHVLIIMTSDLIISKDLDVTSAYNEEKDIFNQYLVTIRNTAETREERQFGAFLQTSSGEYFNYFDQAVHTMSDNDFSSEELNQKLQSIYKSATSHKEYISEMIDEMNGFYDVEAQTAIQQSKSTLQYSAYIFTMLPPFVIFFSILVAFLIIRSFIKPIRKLQTAVYYMSQGDISRRIHSTSTDELGQLSHNFDVMMDKIQAMLGQSKQIASSLTDYATSFKAFSASTSSTNTDILKSIKEIAAGTDEQAEQSEQSFLLITQMEDEYNDMTLYANQVKKTCNEAEENTQIGSTAIHQLKLSSEESESILSKVYDSMDVLAASMKEIGKITHSITEISNQTNILSLNAAIEASRAGQHGKGFAVIAGEVRKLSTESNRSSKAISNITGQLQSKMKEAQEHMMQARVTLKKQYTNVNETTHSFQYISDSMRQISPQIQQIHHRIEKAKQKNAGVVEAIHHMSSVCQQTAAGAEEVTATSTQQDSSIKEVAKQADEISLLTHKLLHEINQFQMDKKMHGAF